MGEEDKAKGESEGAAKASAVDEAPSVPGEATAPSGPPPGGSKVKRAKISRGGKLPSPKKAKKERESEAIHKIATKETGQSVDDDDGPSSAPLTGLQATERVLDTAERFTLWLRDNWQVVAAAVLLVGVVVLFAGWTMSKSRLRTATAFEALAEQSKDETAGPDAFDALLEKHKGTLAADYIRLARARALAEVGTRESLEGAKTAYEAIAKDAETPIAKRIAEIGRGGVEKALGFDAAKVDLPKYRTGEVEGLEPLPAPSPESGAKPAEGEAKPAEGEAKPAEGEAKPAEGEASKPEGTEPPPPPAEEPSAPEPGGDG